MSRNGLKLTRADVLLIPFNRVGMIRVVCTKTVIYHVPHRTFFVASFWRNLVFSLKATSRGVSVHKSEHVQSGMGVFGF